MGGAAHRASATARPRPDHPRHPLSVTPAPVPSHPRPLRHTRAPSRHTRALSVIPAPFPVIPAQAGTTPNPPPSPIHPSPLPGGRLGGGCGAPSQHHRSPTPRSPTPSPLRHTRALSVIPAPPLRHSCAGRNHPPQTHPLPQFIPPPFQGEARRGVRRTEPTPPLVHAPITRAPPFRHACAPLRHSCAGRNPPRAVAPRSPPMVGSASGAGSGSQRPTPHLSSPLEGERDELGKGGGECREILAASAGMTAARRWCRVTG